MLQKHLLEGPLHGLHPLNFHVSSVHCQCTVEYALFAQSAQAFHITVEAGRSAVYGGTS